jgi:hypothetical protein
MTTALPVEQLSAQARDVHFGRTAATACAGIFVAIGWTFGVIWHGLVFCALSARYGFWRGQGLSDGEIAARLSPPPAAGPAAAQAQLPRPDGLNKV